MAGSILRRKLKELPDEGADNINTGGGGGRTKKKKTDYKEGSIKDLEKKRYNDLVARLQTEVDPKVLSSIIEKADAAKRNLKQLGKL